MRKVLLLYHPDFKQHQTGPEHPEAPWRAEAIYRYLLRGPLRKSLEVITPQPAPFERLTLIHDPAYLFRFEEACFRGLSFLDSPDNAISYETFEVARLAAGAALEAVDLALEGNPLLFCPVRPPGHHAERQRALGFCFLNNVALAASYWKQKGGKRILILDWDAHHGNGLQEAFYEDPHVFYISLHENPKESFPGTGLAEERGQGKGLGFTLNIPLPLESGDETYLRIFQEIVSPQVEWFQPEGILVAAGFDAHRDDDFSFLNLSTKGFALLSEFLREWQEKFSAPIISVLEGGYEPKALLTSVEAHLSVLLG